MHKKEANLISNWGKNTNGTEILHFPKMVKITPKKCNLLIPNGCRGVFLVEK